MRFPQFSLCSFWNNNKTFFKNNKIKILKFLIIRFLSIFLCILCKIIQFFLFTDLKISFHDLLFIWVKNKNHLVKLNNPIPMHIRATNGLNLSPITAALLRIPLKPCLWDSTKLGQMARMYDAVQIMNNTTINILSKLKNALYSLKYQIYHFVTKSNELICCFWLDLIKN